MDQAQDEQVPQHLGVHVKGKAGEPPVFPLQKLQDPAQGVPDGLIGRQQALRLAVGGLDGGGQETGMEEDDRTFDGGEVGAVLVDLSGPGPQPGAIRPPGAR
ncbi:hypothetical protein GCM10018793_69360 [Streptomyces sulfonofaciens]|uniref:Uncharacterized protein n=2 Tax=Streptomyces sulfonofaciens TaxID=68272 RepID=A0A919GPR7_9ACTN|nr:hypothetical protein GCM10018793_69360 [Streptomyces sulfonofaciens]